MAEEQSGLGNKAAKMLYSLSVGRLLSVILTILVFVYVARALQSSSFGVYTYAFGFASLVVGGFSAFGTGQFFNTRISGMMERKEHGEIGRTLMSGYILIVGVGLLLTLIAVAISGYVASHFLGEGSQTVVMIIASVAIFFFIVKSTSENALVGFGKGNLSSIALIVTSAIQLGLSVFFVKTLPQQYWLEGAAAAMLIGYFVGFVLGVIYVIRCMRRIEGAHFTLPSRKELYDAFKFSAPIGANNFLNTGVNNFSIILLGAYVSTSALGNYGIALKGLSLIAVFYNAMVMTLIHSFSAARSSRKDDDRLKDINRKIFRYSLLVSLPIFVYIGVLAKPSLSVILSAALYPTAPFFLLVIAVGTIINCIGFYLSGLLVANNYTVKTLKYAMISSLFQFAALWLLVPQYKVLGGIIAIFIVGSLIDDVLYIRGVVKVLRIKFEYWKTAKLYMSSAVLGVLLSACLLLHGNVVELIAGFVLMVLLYPVILVAMGSLNAEDIESMGRAIKRIYILERPINWFLSYSAFLLRLKGQ